MKLMGLARLGRDAELRYTQQGDPVAGFSIAYNYGKKDQDGNQPVQFIQCSLWGKRAESLAPYLLKGKRFLIELDDVHIEEYTGRDGLRGTSLKGRVVDVGFADTFEHGDGFDKPVNHHEDRRNPGPPAHSSAANSATSQAPRNSYADAKGKAQPPLASQPPAASMDDMEDDIPF